jgi:hypothetical protein
MSDPEVVDAIVPEEPLQDSVVLDRSGVAWQRKRSSWGFYPDGGRDRDDWIAAAHHDVKAEPLGWRRLLAERGPLTIVHRAVAEAT